MPKYKVFVRQVWSIEMSAKNQMGAHVFAQDCIEKNLMGGWSKEWSSVQDIIHIDQRIENGSDKT